jgi:predicted lipoprotein
MRRLVANERWLTARTAVVCGSLCAALLPACRKDDPSEIVFTGRPASTGTGAGATGGSAPSSGGTTPNTTGGSSNATGGAGSQGGTGARGGGGGSGATPASGGSGGTGNTTGSGAQGGTAHVGEGGTTHSEAGQGASSGGGDTGEGGSGAEGGAPPQTVPFTKQALLQSIAECSLGQYERFLTLAEDLAELAALARDVPSAEAEAAVRNAFLQAMASFQRVEVLRFGPAARSSEEPAAGRDLRDQIYAWRLGGRCNVDTELVSRSYTNPDFPTTSLINARGLGATEYLLFYPNPDNGCPSYFPLNQSGEWAALGADEIWTRRREYTAVVTDAIATRARELLDAWDPASQDFTHEFVAAGAGSSAYASQQAALNAVSNALFYVEKEVKDYKLGIPLALSPECTQATCPEALESQYAHISTQNIAENLEGFERLFRGCGEGGLRALGFDDWLVAVGAGDLSQRMLTALAGAKTAVAELDPPIEQALVSNTDRVLTVYYAVKALTDLLKTEFVTVLDLELPKSSEGDND